MKKIVIIIVAVCVSALCAVKVSAQASRWEGVQDSTTPQQAPAPAPKAQAPAAQPSTPAYPPPPSAAAPAPSRGGCKSDIPGVPCEDTVVPPGAVRLEDVKAGTRPKTGEAAPAPAAKAAPAPAAKAAPAPAETAPAYDPTLYDTRNQPAVPPPGYSQPATTQTAPRTYAPDAPQPAAPRAAMGGCKSDIPNMPCEDTAVPPGAVRLEDVKPGTKAKPQPITAPPAAAAAPVARPAPAPVTRPSPAPVPAQPSTVYGGHKSDLPGGWDEPTQVPPGAMRIEDVKPGTRPQTGAGVTPKPVAPTAETPPPSKSKIEEVPVGADETPEVQTKQEQRWQ